ncbi:non-canonical purine NTP pyrophosphatase [Candidatus Saccharibacteria bacterium]|nr:non-canonical purine NTP pyrophosphatase [Candidatus Saccharibacteria bacterium]
MKQVTFITGNQNKANYLAKYLGMPIEHIKIDLDELQSLDLSVVVEHKVKQAYEAIKKPVLVEDVALEFTALGRIPGPLIKWFLDELDLKTICSLLDGKDRSAIGRCMFGYYDGERLELIEGSINGTVPDRPGGESGFGWDPIFIPEGYDVTRAELSDEDYQKVYEQIRPIKQLKEFLESQD